MSSNQTPDTPIARGEARGWSHNPSLPIGVNPTFAWPPRPAAALGWIGGTWLRFTPMVIIFLCAVVGNLLLPDAERMKTLAAGWMLEIWLRNGVLITLIAGGLHLYFITLAGQGKKLKFDPRDQARSNRQFLFNSQVHENVFFSLVSGTTLITAFEVLYQWAAANGVVPSFRLSLDQPWSILGFVALLLVIPAWSSLHFYWVHRFLHWPPLYRIAHRLHHKNVNVGPWSGVSMHPIEHVLYYSSVLIHFVVPTTPLLFIYHVCYEHLSPPFSHSGFEKVVIRDRERLKAGDFFHQLHHRHFECNYGTSEMPWDVWFGSFDNGTTESRERQRARLKAAKRDAPREDAS